MFPESVGVSTSSPLGSFPRYSWAGLKLRSSSPVILFYDTPSFGTAMQIMCCAYEMAPSQFFTSSFHFLIINTPPLNLLVFSTSPYPRKMAPSNLVSLGSPLIPTSQSMIRRFTRPHINMRLIMVWFIGSFLPPCAFNSELRIIKHLTEAHSIKMNIDTGYSGRHSTLPLTLPVRPRRNVKSGFECRT